MKQQVRKICQSTYLELCRISSITELDMSSQLMLPKPLWHPWFCHALITVIPCCQGFLNSSLTNFKRFRIVLLDSFSKRPNAHVSPLLAKLHWLPIAQRIEYKISSFCYCSAVLVWSLLPLCPFPFTVFLCWNPHLLDSNTKEKVPRAGCFLPSRPCHLEQTPLLCTSCSNAIPVQNSTQNHTIPLSIRTRLLELLCVFSCSPTFSCMWPAPVCVGVGREREQMKLQWFDFQPFGVCILVACNP